MPHVIHSARASCEAPVWLPLIAVLIVFVYLRGWFRLKSSGSNALPVWRAASLILGLLLALAAVTSPLTALDEGLLTGHMIQHLLLMTLAPPLLLLGAPVMALFHGFPRSLVETAIGPIFRHKRLQQFGKTIGHPAFCWLAAAVTLVGWHVPAAFTLGLQSEAWHVIEHASFFGTGLLFWWPVVQPWPSVPTWPQWSILLYLFLATLPCDVLSAFLVFSDRIAYPVYLSTPRQSGLSVLEDQQCAGALMWTCVTVVYLVAGTILSTRLLSPQSNASISRPDSERVEIAL